MIGSRLYIFLMMAAACSPISNRQLTRTFHESETKFQNHIGFVLYDVEKRKSVYSFNGHKYFTPASNTKIFTFYAALTLLGDSIPGIYYARRGDSLIFRGTGDPSFLYDQVMYSDRIFNFLRDTRSELYFSTNNFSTTSLGPGWAWSDYRHAYSSERSAFPVYGNTYRVSQKESSALTVTPSYFKKYFWLADSAARAEVMREIGSNRTEYFPASGPRKIPWRIPFKTDENVIADLLQDTLHRKVSLLPRTMKVQPQNILFSLPADSLYKLMMQQSDNFVAEQLLLVCAGVLSDTLKPEIAIRYIKENYLSDLPDSPVWVDGSGLSRYNLFTPRSIVRLWEKIYDSVDQQRLFPLLAIGGKSGTIKNLYVSDPPYIYGKTGTLSNNHALSGFLITKNGTTLIFSYMNSHYTVPASEIRKQMESVLRQIHDNY
jgi:serine-type D-Ala-D-Ala carboxypeptidase/endopeptidase (penicillin-binding protein 4)